MHIRSIIVYAIIFLFLNSPVLAQELLQEESMHVVVEPTLVRVEIPKQSGQTYSVWHTNNPMKVIIDVTGKVPGAPEHLPVSDVALHTIRATQASDGATRVVLDFAYMLPEPVLTETADKLIIEISKVFVQGSERLVSPGVHYGHQRRASPTGPNIVNYLKMDILNPTIEMKLVLAQDTIAGRELVSSMAKRSEAIAAVNGAYFALDGRPLGVLAIDGILISEPYAQRTALGLGSQVATIDSLDLIASLGRPDGEVGKITGLNRPRLQNDLILFTPYYGKETGTNIYGRDVAVVDDIVVATHDGSLPIPENGVVVSGHGLGRDFLDELQVGDVVDLQIQMEPDWLDLGITQIIGGGPRLVKNGEIFITGEVERFQNDILVGRAPRTALGLTPDGKLFLVTVNGRQPGISVGMTLAELAELMIELGAVQAMNLDGGGSTTMVIRDRVLNLPSDKVERAVSNALVVITPESRTSFHDE